MNKDIRKKGSKYPNVVFIVADDLGCCDLGFYGNNIACTPNIDEFANNSLHLSCHYSSSPMCAPARASLQTGKYPHRTGAFDVACVRGVNRMNPAEITLPKILQQHGYKTALIGKWHNGGGAEDFHPYHYGYDLFFGYQDGSSPYFNFKIETDYGVFTYYENSYITDVLTDKAIEFIQQNRDTPFFLQLAYSAPHRPLEAQECDLKYFEEYNCLSNEIKTLYAMIRSLDRNIGRFLHSVDGNGLSSNTIIVLLSDNGPDFVGGLERPHLNYSGHKGDVLEGGIRVPAFIRYDHLFQSGTVYSAPTHFVDWMPTILDILGFEAPNDIDGKSMIPQLLKGKEGLFERFWQWTRYEIIPASNAAVRCGSYKLVYPVRGDSTKFHTPDMEYAKKIKGSKYDLIKEPIKRTMPPPPAPKLFNIDNDVGETHDLSAEKPEIAQQLKEKLDNWINNMIFEYEKVKDSIIK